jgi:fumarylacetoacetase
MTSSAYSHHFSINNLPFGVASSSQHPQPQCVTRLSNTVIFLGDLQRAGLFRQVTGLPREAFDNPTLNSFAALDKRVHKQVRQVLQSALQDSGVEKLPTGSTEPITAIRMHLPVSIPAFTG